MKSRDFFLISSTFTSQGNIKFKEVCLHISILKSSVKAFTVN